MINELVKHYTWGKVSYGADSWALGEEDRIYLQSYETCCWRKKKLIWTDSYKGDEVLRRLKAERDILHTRKRGMANFTGHILRRNCLLNCVTEGKIERTGRRGKKRKQLFHDPTEKGRHWKLKKEAYDCTVWRSRLSGYGAVAKRTTRWRHSPP